MLRNDQEEQQDVDAEAQFWQEWDGKTGCAGQVARMIVLVVVLAHSLYQLIAV